MKKVLFIVIALALAIAMAIPMAMPAAADGSTTGYTGYVQTIYVSDSGAVNNGTTTIYSVNFANGQADLTPLPTVLNSSGTSLGLSPGQIPFDEVDALACSPDGTKLYAINKFTGDFGYLDLTTDEWYQPGNTGIPDCVLAACSSDGTLWAASQQNDELYTVNTTTGLATEVGVIEAGTTKVNVQGADIAWGAGPTLYLWTNGSTTGAKAGLYTLSIQSSNVQATYLGPGSSAPFFTGLAIEDGGVGDLLGSVYGGTNQGEIVVIDKSTGDTVATYPTYLNGSPYDLGYGDMTIGALEIPANIGSLTMGFWQNKNGQKIINNSASTDNVSDLGTWLRQYAPFDDLSDTATTAQVASYVYSTIKDATGSDMNSMLKAQMLATALDVYFSEPANGNPINAPNPIGDVIIDLTHINAPIGSSTYIDVSSAFTSTSESVSQMLTDASNENTSATEWYGQVKATQELAKDAFDAVNNW